MPAGRPTKYTKDMPGKAMEYLEERQDTMEDGRYKVKLPTVEGFGRWLGVNKSTLYEWETHHPEFSDALDQIRTEQKERLLDSGLSGDYNSTIAKLILSSNHGMAEKQDVNNNHTGEIATRSVFQIEGVDGDS